MKRPSVTATTTTSTSAAPRAQRITKAAPATKPSKTSAPKTKLDMLVELMRAKSGASIEQLAKATGWQKHSVRGAISGALKKGAGINIVSGRVNGVRVYRIAK